MTTCKKDHRYNAIFENLPVDQASFNGRHKCAGCAYEAGYQAGLEQKKNINIDDVIKSIPDSQAGTVRHKSPVAAFILGYDEGLKKSYR